MQIQHTPKRSERFATPEPIRLRLEVPVGEVRVETGGESETTVELAPAHDDAESREAVERARIDFRDGELVVVVPERRTFGISFGRRGEVDLRVSTPRGAAAAIETKSADVVARGRYSRAKIGTASGNVEIGEIDGDADFDTVSGTLRSGPIGGKADVNVVSGPCVLERVGGRLRVTSVSGDVTVGEAREGVKVEGVACDVRLDSVETGDVELRSISGDLRVAVKSGSRLAVDANAVSGDLRSDIELGADEASAGDEGPLVDLRARTVSGDLRITRAEAAPPS